MIELTVLFFGELAELAATKETTLSNIKDTSALNDTSTLVDYIHENYPRLRNKTFNLALNREIITEKRLVKNGDEIALLPPYAGG